MSKRAIILARVSTDHQRDNYSVPTQIRAALTYAKEHHFSIVGDQFADPETGKTCACGQGAPVYVDDYTSRELSRPALDAGLRFLETVGADAVIVHAIDRLARDPYVRKTLEMEIEKLGAKVEYVLGNYDESPEGEVRKDMDATFAKWENAKRVERTNRGKRGKAERGLFVAGTAPYGYRIDPASPGGLAVDRQEAVIVQRIFELYGIRNWSARAIAAALSREQVRNHSGETAWVKSTVTRILSNETYAGRCYYNKNKRRGHRLVRRDKAEWIAIRVQPIVAQDAFDLAQNRMRQNKKIKRGQPKRFYLLSGMVFCATCERVFIAQTKPAGRNRRAHDGQTYRHRVKEGHCRNMHMAANKLEQDVWATVVDAILNPDNLRRGYLEALEHDKANRTRTLMHLETLNRNMGRLEQKRDALNNAYIDPDITMAKTEYIKLKTGLEAEMKDLTAQIEDGQGELARTRPPADLDTFERFTAEIREALLKNVDPEREHKRRVLELLHIHVSIQPNRQHKVSGWFYGDAGNEDDSSGGLSNLTSAHCAPRPPPPPGHA